MSLLKCIFKTTFFILLLGPVCHADERDELLQEVANANQAVYRWQAQKATQLIPLLEKRGQADGPDTDFDIYFDSKIIPMRPYSIAELRRDAATMQLVNESYSYQGLDRYAGIFIESGAAWTGSFQWDSLHFIGFEEKYLRDRLLDRALENKIYNIRVGVNIHQLDLLRPETLNALIDFHKEAWRRGISITDAVLFFSGLQNLENYDARGNVDPQLSYQNNPRFVEYVEAVAGFTLQAIFREERIFNQQNEALPPERRLPAARTAVNPVNEPETFAGFNHFWNRGLSRWGSPNVMSLYVPTIINIAKANVRIRMAALKAAGRRVLFFHNEAMTTEVYPSHQSDLRFAVSKFMLGDPDLMKANFDSLAKDSIKNIRDRFERNKKAGHLSVVEASILKYVSVPAFTETHTQEKARRFIVSQLRSLQEEHKRYTREMHGDAKTDTILMLDYYQQTEFALPAPVPTIVHTFAANHGEKLRQALGVKTDEAFLGLLKTYAQRSEPYTERTMWQDYKSVNEINLENFLGQDDAIILDKMMGLRNEWRLREEDLFRLRRQNANFNYAWLQSNDEHRIDYFLNRLIAENGKLLKKGLSVANDGELFAVLKKTASEAGLKIRETDALQQILNLSERAIFHRLFGFDRNRLIGFLPPHYARQARAGLRDGFDRLFLKYVDELGIRIGGIGESGTPYYPWVEMVQEQMMIGLVRAAKQASVFVVRHDIGPAVGTIGWMNGPMTGDLGSNGTRGEDGVFKMVEVSPGRSDYQLSAWKDSKPWYTSFRELLRDGLE